MPAQAHWTPASPRARSLALGHGGLSTLRPPISNEDVLDDIAEDVSQTEVAARVAIRQPLVIDAELVKNRRVQIVDRHAVFYGAEPEIVRRAVGMPPFTPPPAMNIEKP